MLHLELHASLVTAYSSTVAQRVTCAADASGAVHHGRAACVRPAVLLQHGACTASAEAEIAHCSEKSRCGTPCCDKTSQRAQSISDGALRALCTAAAPARGMLPPCWHALAGTLRFWTVMWSDTWPWMLKCARTTPLTDPHQQPTSLSRKSVVHGTPGC